MKNSEIVLQNSVFLMEQGLLKGTGEMIMFSDENGTREVERPEPIHTYDEWGRLGYQVRKGEHAIAKFPIWKFKPGKKAKQEQEKEDEEEKVPSKGRYIWKTAFFFTMAQVDLKEQKS